MQNVLLGLLFVSIIALVVGLINPSLIIRRGDQSQKTRKLVIMYLIPVILVLFMGIGMIAKNDPDFQAKQAQQREQTANGKAAKAQQQEQVANEKQEKMSLRTAVQNAVTITAMLDRGTLDMDGNTKVGVFIKNNSDYRIIKGTIRVTLKDAAGHNVDSESFGFAKPMEPGGEGATVLWLKAKRAAGYETSVTIDEFEKPATT